MKSFYFSTLNYIPDRKFIIVNTIIFDSSFIFYDLIRNPEYINEGETSRLDELRYMFDKYNSDALIDIKFIDSKNIIGTLIKFID